MKKTKTQATDGEKISQTQQPKKKNQTIQLKKDIRHEQILCQRGYTNGT